MGLTKKKLKTCEMIKKEIEGEKSNFIHDIQRGTVLITGATSGLGRKLALELSDYGGHFILPCRDTRQGNILVNEMKAIAIASANELTAEVMYCDLSSLSSVSSFCSKLKEKLEGSLSQKPLALMVLNAGIKPNGRKRRITWDGFEKTFQVNVLSQAFIYFNLLSKFEALSDPKNLCKIITIGSKTGFNGPYSTPLNDYSKPSELMRKLFKPNYVEKYSSSETYNSSKFTCMLLAKFISESGRDKGLSSCSVNPGYIPHTRLRRKFILKRLVSKMTKKLEKKNRSSLDTGCANVLNCCLTSFENLNGLCMEKNRFKSIPTLPLRNNENEEMNGSKLVWLMKSVFKKFDKFEEDVRTGRNVQNNNMFNYHNFELDMLYNHLRFDAQEEPIEEEIVIQEDIREDTDNDIEGEDINLVSTSIIDEDSFSF